MADTYTQLLVQFIFVVKYRENLIHEENREELEAAFTEREPRCGWGAGRLSKVLA